MADVTKYVSKVNVGGVNYEIKDSVARQSAKDVSDSLGGLAFKDSASGKFTPAGTVNKPTVTVTPKTETVKAFNAAGSLPTWSASVDDTTETLSFTFTAGSLPTSVNKTVVTGITSTTVGDIEFTGTEGTVTVS